MLLRISRTMDTGRVKWTLILEARNGFPPGPNDRLHWQRRANRTDSWRSAVYVACEEQQIPRLGRVRIEIIYHTARGPATDNDNLVAKSKPLLDGLQGAYVGPSWRRAYLPGVLPNDSAAHLEHSFVREIRDGKRFIEMVIEDVSGVVTGAPELESSDPAEPTCLECGRPLPAVRYRRTHIAGRRYCSADCRITAARRRNNPKHPSQETTL